MSLAYFISRDPHQPSMASCTAFQSKMLPNTLTKIPLRALNGGVGGFQRFHIIAALNPIQSISEYVAG